MLCASCRRIAQLPHFVTGDVGLIKEANCDGLIKKLDAAYSAVRDAAYYPHQPDPEVAKAIERAMDAMERTLETFGGRR